VTKFKGDVEMEKVNYTDYGVKKDKEENNKPKADRIKDGLKAIAVVSIAAGLYGFKLGRRSGYRRGVKVGESNAVDRMCEAWQQHTEEMRRYRGE
jgi:hypothetical protein